MRLGPCCGEHARIRDAYIKFTKELEFVKTRNQDTALGRVEDVIEKIKILA